MNDKENLNDINKSNLNEFKVTLKDIAIRTGFTINTVSRALKDKDDISAATKKIICETAKEMGYISNTIAGALRSGITKTIAIILGDISNPLFSIMVKEIENTVKMYQYNIFIINTNEKYEIEEQAIYSALSKKVDGIIICPTQKSDANIKLLQRSGVPFVLMGRHFDDDNFDYVVWDDTKGGYLATQHLIEKGHKQILFLNGTKYISSSRERLEGYKKALTENGIDILPELIKEIPVTTGGCQKVLMKLIDNKVEFTSIFAFSDMIAWEAIYILNKRGIKVPDDIAVVGFDNIQSQLPFPFPLTTVGGSKSKMARLSLEILLKKIREENNEKHYNKVIDTHLVIREST